MENEFGQFEGIMPKFPMIELGTNWDFYSVFKRHRGLHEEDF